MTRCLPLLVALAGCYQPELRDCTVTCERDDGCPAGQACTGGLCAAGGVSCEAADASAPSSADLHVVVLGKGKVELPALRATCEGKVHEDGDCHFTVAAGTSVELVPMDPGHFDGWTTENCSAEPAACTLVVDAPGVLVEAQYEGD